MKPAHGAPAHHSHTHSHGEDCCAPGAHANSAGKGKADAFRLIAAPAQPAACSSGCCGGAQPLLQPARAKAAPLPPGCVATRIAIAQMDCPVEEGLLRSALGKLEGVVALEFNLLQRVLTITHQPAAQAPILAAIRSVGFTPELLAEDSAPLPAPAAPPLWPLFAAGAMALASETVHWAGLPEWLAAVLAIAAVLGCGTGTFRKGWIAARQANFNINALMSIAVTGALLIGQWPEAAMVMVLFTLAERIEARSLDRARDAIRDLMQLAPEEALVQQADGRWLAQAAADVAVGARVRVRPGERIALDGEVLSGQSAVNQAPITGESLPVEKGVGDAVFAGTVNESGSFEFRVTAPAGNSTLARIIDAIERAQGARAATQRFVDSFARIYTPAVMLFALGVAVLPPLLAGTAWTLWIYKALVLLVIACPCALVISTPVTLVSALAAAARHGILVKGGVYLEKGRKLAWLALDKTGTLTHGKPVLTGFMPLQDDLDPVRLETLAASLAVRSDHPVSRALAAAAAGRQRQPEEVEAFSALPGRGVSGRIGGAEYILGNHRLIHERGLCSAELEARLAESEAAGNSVVMLADASRVLALFAVADTLRPEAKAAIAELHALGVKTLMLSGDNAPTAAAVAARAGIDVAHGELLPEDKLREIVARTGQGAVVGMVGDGINDAPALARADIGFAMGAASSGTAIETADVALMDDDLRKLPRFVRLARRTHAVLVQNIVLALGIKALFLALTLAGVGSMWMAVFADVGAALLVVGNGLRLLRA